MLVLILGACAGGGFIVISSNSVVGLRGLGVPISLKCVKRRLPTNLISPFSVSPNLQALYI